VSRPRTPVFVQVNPVGSQDFSLDIEVIDRGAVAGIVVQRVESTEQLQRVRRAIAKRKAKGSPVGGMLGLIPLIETALGVSRALEIASAPWVVALGFGKEDYRSSMCLPSVADADPYFQRTGVRLDAAVAMFPLRNPSNTTSHFSSGVRCTRGFLVIVASCSEALIIPRWGVQF